MWENSSVSRSYICVRFSEHQRLKNLRVCREREHTFTSPFLLLAACHVVLCSFAVSFDWSNRSNFVASRRAASHLPFGRISRPSVAARIQCPCKANGGPGTAVNYPLYTALPLELILNDPSNLTREREGELRKKDKRCVSPALCHGAPKIHGTTKIARRCQATIEDEEATRDGNQRRIFPGIVFGIPTFPPHRETLLPLYLEEGRFDCE